MTAVRQGRADLGARLRALRKDAYLTGTELARRCNWHSSKVSRIERGHQQPTEKDLAAWCYHTEAMLAHDDLVATLRNLSSMYREWQRIVAGGRSSRQRQSLEIENRAAHIRWYESWVIPGLLQTRAYARAMLSTCRSVIPGGRDDIDEAVEIRIARQDVLHTGRRRLLFLIGEAALGQVVGSHETMAEQLHTLRSHIATNHVAIGIVPLEVNAAIGSHGFAIFDRTQVMVETISAELTVTRPSEIVTYEDVFARLCALAVHGQAAARLISRASAHHEQQV